MKFQDICNNIAFRETINKLKELVEKMEPKVNIVNHRNYGDSLRNKIDWHWPKWHGNSNPCGEISLNNSISYHYSIGNSIRKNSKIKLLSSMA